MLSRSNNAGECLDLGCSIVGGSNLIGHGIYSVENDCIDKESYSTISAVLKANRCVPHSFELLDCAEEVANTREILVVKIMCGKDPIPITELACEEKPCAELEGIETPPTPTPP